MRSLIESGFVLCVLQLSLSYFLFFFFFQAEDGIRDLIVTGVQTCALPIYHETTARQQAREMQQRGFRRRAAAVGRIEQRAHQAGPLARPYPSGDHLPHRSEERRVGEECRSRWSPDHLKKKKKPVKMRRASK